MWSTAVPVQVCKGPEGCRRLRLSEFLDNRRYMKVARLSALRTSRLYRQEILVVLIAFGSWVDTRAIGRPEGLSQWNISVTSVPLHTLMTYWACGSVVLLIVKLGTTYTLYIYVGLHIKYTDNQAAAVSLLYLLFAGCRLHERIYYLKTLFALQCSLSFKKITHFERVRIRKKTVVINLNVIL